MRENIPIGVYHEEKYKSTNAHEVISEYQVDRLGQRYVWRKLVP